MSSLYNRKETYETQRAYLVEVRLERATCVWLKRANLVLILPPKSILCHPRVDTGLGQRVVLSQLPPRLKPYTLPRFSMC